MNGRTIRCQDEAALRLLLRVAARYGVPVSRSRYESTRVLVYATPEEAAALVKVATHYQRTAP